MIVTVLPSGQAEARPRSARRRPKTTMTVKTLTYPSKGGGFNELRADDITTVQGPILP